MKNKDIILNTIHSVSFKLEQTGFKYLRDNCKWGLRKGKYAVNNMTIEDLRELADALEEYMDDGFDLNDMQDYQE